jgi:hypothetical protein
MNMADLTSHSSQILLWTCSTRPFWATEPLDLSGFALQIKTKSSRLMYGRTDGKFCVFKLGAMEFHIVE